MTELLAQLFYLFNHENSCCSLVPFPQDQANSGTQTKCPKDSPGTTQPERSWHMPIMFQLCLLVRTVQHHLQSFYKELRLGYGHPNNFSNSLAKLLCGYHISRGCCWLLESSLQKYCLWSSAEGCHSLFMRNLPFSCSCSPRETNACCLIII